MDVQTILKEKLNCPTLHGEMEEALRLHQELTAGKMARAVLKQNGLSRSHVSTAEFSLLKQRIKRAARSNKRLFSEVKTIDKNQQTIIKPCHYSTQKA